MARTLEDLDREVSALRVEVEQLRQQAGGATTLRRFAGCFTGDPDWAEIHDQIEERRRQPDPELTDA